MTVHLVAIVGGSGSGKTWLARRLKRRLGRHAGLVSLDDFYRDLSALPKRERDRRNFDDPAAIEWGLFLETLARIKRGEPAAIPRYDFASHTRQRRARAWKPKPIVLLDGLWLLRETQARRLYSLSVYLDAPGETRLQWRIARDRKERGRSRASVLRQFREQVEPMHARFVAPQARHADIVLDSPAGDKVLGRLAAMVTGLATPPRMNR
ncbi:MAG: uridine kinase [Verrucomicrobia bacterium]|nr:uridine kinase [Verrucomicrobiota bacterium]